MRGADAVLIGQLLRTDSGLALEFELHRVSDSSRMWTERYAFTLGDVLQVEDRITQTVLAQVDTVRTAKSLAELMAAIIPDSARTWFDSVCEPAFHGPRGDSLTGSCRIQAVYAKPCTLVGDLSFHGRLL